MEKSQRVPNVSVTPMGLWTDILPGLWVCFSQVPYGLWVSLRYLAIVMGRLNIELQTLITK